ncbi:hypothetical protein SLE2022_050680 [Rubroshorea leprosula]
MNAPPFPAVNTFRPLPNPRLLPPAVVPVASSFRCKDVTLRRGSRISLTKKHSVLACKSNLQANLIFSSKRSSQGTHQELHCLFSSGTRFHQFGLSHINTMLHGQHGRSLISPMAFYQGEYFKFRYPVITKKPEWWWRTLACLPYLIALQISDTGYFLQPFLRQHEILEDLIFYIPGAIKRWPPWFTMIYYYFGYAAIVKNKDWPHYFRFHLMMGMLLETTLQLASYTFNFFPLIHYNGTFGMQFWTGIGFINIWTLLVCMGYALGGNYAPIPFISDAAYIHTLFNIGSFQRPF